MAIVSVLMLLVLLPFCYVVTGAEQLVLQVLQNVRNTTQIGESGPGMHTRKRAAERERESDRSQTDGTLVNLDDKEAPLESESADVGSQAQYTTTAASGANFDFEINSGKRAAERVLARHSAGQF